MFIRRNPFARIELHKRSDGQGNCAFCGQRKKIIWKYQIESDGGRVAPLSGVFCTILCLEAYNGNTICK